MGTLWKTCYELSEGHRRAYLAQLLVQVVQIFFQVFMTFLTKVVIDAIQGAEELAKANFLEDWVVWLITGGSGNEYLLEHRLAILPTALVATAAILGLVSFLRMWLRSYAIAYVNGSMQRVLFRKLEGVPYSFYKKVRAGDILQTCTRDVDVLRRFMIGDVSNFNYSFWMVLLSGAVLLSLSWKMMLATLGLLPFMILYSFFLMKKVRSLYRQTDDSEARLTGRVNENLLSARLVRAFGTERREIDGFEGYLSDYAGKYLLWRRWASFFFASSDIFAFGSNALALGVGVYLAFLGEVNASTIVLSFLFVNMVVWPVRQVATSLSNMGQYMASADRLREILDAPMEDRTSGISPAIKGAIRFEGVSFRYEDGDEEVLREVSFALPAGKTLAVMGRTGSGKSTLSLLLTRLYEPTEGAIYLDEVPLHGIRKDYLRRMVVPVLQDPFLFSKSIEENLLLARMDAPEEEIREATKAASIDDTILAFKDGYRTQVGERGMSLSGGQKQRVAIARTLLARPRVLIFDDSLSAVDTVTDRNIRQNLRKREDGSTLLIVTHRISTAQDADLILMLEDGRIKEMGTHEELLALGGEYAHIAAIQKEMV